MGDTVQANDGAMLPLDSLAQSFTYAGGFVTQISVFYQGNTYIQTFINNGTNIVFISNWVNPLYPIPGDVMDTESGDTMITETGDIMITQL